LGLGGSGLGLAVVARRRQPSHRGRSPAGFARRRFAARIHMKRWLGVTLSVALLATAWLAAAPSTTPVADAAMGGDGEAVRTLLKQGADVGASHADGMTALHWAAERGDSELAEMLVYAGANVSAVTRIGQYTPLHLASKAANAAVVEALLKAGAS